MCLRVFVDVFFPLCLMVLDISFPLSRLVILKDPTQPLGPSRTGGGNRRVAVSQIRCWRDRSRGAPRVLTHRSFNTSLGNHSNIHHLLLLRCILHTRQTRPSRYPASHPNPSLARTQTHPSCRGVLWVAGILRGSCGGWALWLSGGI